ncbi:OmpA/MotB family protein [Thermanaeromonas sp. C210]|uniref:OmpA/MotB family protein n=1 Tax=Thermanaeromonas sp. C210 TaxID=2731925 RepID=UPI00155C7B53|nr:flagellar motor protein MotB [Thermanaeromonas sp. C210]GFN22639.1 chemotaxis protein MotB [Thermanaeromonas sp. C210]
MLKRGREENHDNKERWLLTYADLITLLMIFFVVMYAISDTNMKKLSALAQSLSQALTGTPGGLFTEAGPSMIPGLSGGPALPQAASEGQESSPLDQIYTQLNEYIAASGLQQEIILTKEERGLVVGMVETVLFPRGSDQLTPRAREIITRVGKMLAPLPNYLRIEGHTDNLPIQTERFPSNWELASARALNVLHVLITEAGISPERLSATSYGEYRPLVPNDTEENMARNRRVDIVVLKETFNVVEPHLE